MNHTTLHTTPRVRASRVFEACPELKRRGRITCKLKQLSISTAMLTCLIASHNIGAMNPSNTCREYILASASRDGTIKIWDISKNDEECILSLEDKGLDHPNSIAFSPFENNILASAYEGGELKIFDLSRPKDKECIRTLDAHLTGPDYKALCVAFSPFDKNKLASSSVDKTVKIFDLSMPEGQECIHNLTGHRDQVLSVSFSPVNRNIIFSTTFGSDSPNSSRRIRIWDLSNPNTKKYLSGHDIAVFKLAFDPFNENRIASPSRDATIKIWDLSRQNGNECVKTLYGHGWCVSAVEFSPFCRNILASSSIDKTIKIWDLSKPEGHECIKTLIGHEKSVYSVSFSPYNENILASASEDKTIKIWDLSKPEGHECIKTLTGHTDGVKRVSFAPKIETKEQDEFKKKLVLAPFGRRGRKFLDVTMEFAE